jgi:hypothetical protein
MEQKWKTTWALLDVAHLQYPLEITINDRFVIWEWSNRPQAVPGIRIVSEEMCLNKMYHIHWFNNQENRLRDHPQPPTTWLAHSPVQVAHGASMWRLVEVVVDMYDINPELWKVTETWSTSGALPRPAIVVMS